MVPVPQEFQRLNKNSLAVANPAPKRRRLDAANRSNGEHASAIAGSAATTDDVGEDELEADVKAAGEAEQQMPDKGEEEEEGGKESDRGG